VLNQNPSSIEYLLEYYAGGTGKFFNQLFKTAIFGVETAIGKTEEPLDYRMIPIASRFMVRPPRNIEHYKDYWTISDEMRNRAHYRKQAVKEGDPYGVLQSYYQGPLVEAEKIFNVYKKEIDRYTDLIQEVEDKELKASLYKRRDELIKMAVTQVKQAQQKTLPK
jgi:hypothetical protein